MCRRVLQCFKRFPRGPLHPVFSTALFLFQTNADDGVVTIPQLHTCSCDHEVYYTGVLYVIQGMMLAFGAFLAWETRNVTTLFKQPALKGVFTMGRR